MKFQKIGFIGLGLIGGSLAKLIKEIYPDLQLFALVKTQSTLDYALNNKIIDRGTILESKIPSDLDLVFICTPINLINHYIEIINKLGTKTTIITDVGSVKEQVHPELSSLKEKLYIGGHPMAGKETSGIKEAESSLLKQKTYILIKEKNPLYFEFKTFLQSLSFKILELNSRAEHDNLVAITSHFPYLMAVLTSYGAKLATEKLPNNDNFALLKTIVSTGFIDTTRVSSSPLEWGLDICKFNKKNILSLLQIMRLNLNNLEQAIINEDKETMENIFVTAKNFRKELLQ